MSKNLTVVAVADGGILALRCECGNLESITDSNPTYKTFGYWIDSAKKTGEGYCKQCCSDVHLIRVTQEAAAVAAATKP